MPTYTAYATMSTNLTYTFTAKDDEEARQIVGESDGFEYSERGGDWNNESLYRHDDVGNPIKEIQL